ncbi:VWA domain-containing protein [Bacillus cereus group sp. BfR-BA-02730]|uniref:VWA domain-containing protein n=1 Tax=Bacillus cereus group sp. BfR-BA-02730 TaxID=3094893 RepID=UPI0029C3F287|nr:VWA domain-containing protein [Bacillus cereus group sp. BfR-BA-02730]MDX5808622.1 VWA domain-containing protein [Bacillus cereus group sp. BfR-BA-02730]
MAITLEKKTEIAKIVLEKVNLTGVVAQVVFVLDGSTSMTHLYNNNTVQDVTESILAVALNIDDNNSIDVYGFGKSHRNIGNVSRENYRNYIQNVFLKKFDLEPYTAYAGVMNEIVNEYGTKTTTKTIEQPKSGFLSKLLGKTEVVKVDKEQGPVKHPTFVVFITDGDNFDKPEAERIIRESSDQPIFWQFVGIGQEGNFSFLEKLDNMGGRVIDNANFVRFTKEEINSMSQEKLYEKLMNEFPLWIKEAKAHGFIQ